MKRVLPLSGARIVEDYRCGVFIAQVFCNVTFCPCLDSIHGSARSAESPGSSGNVDVVESALNRPSIFDQHQLVKGHAKDLGAEPNEWPFVLLGLRRALLLVVIGKP